MTLDAQQTAELMRLSVRNLYRKARTVPGFPQPLPYRQRGKVWSEAQVKEYLS